MSKLAGAEAAKLKKFSDAGGAKSGGCPTPAGTDSSGCFGIVIMNKEDRFHLGAKALIQNCEGKLLLLQSPLEKIGTERKDYWDIPGGRIQKNESLEEALKREVYEETGLQNITGISPLLMTLSSTRIPLQNGDDVGLILAIYLCEVLDDTPIRLSNEHIHFGWFEPGRVAELLKGNFPLALTEKIANLNLVIPCIKNKV